MMQPPPPQSVRQGSGATWIIVVLSVVGGLILVIGILAVLGIVGMRRYLSAAKSAEARNDLGSIGRDAVASYEREDIMTGSLTHSLCSSATVPVPKNERALSGKKYQSSSSDWMVDAPNGGFACLKFEVDDPQFYQLKYTRTGTGSKIGDSFLAEARGDLDGNGVFSSFTLSGHVMAGDMVMQDPNIKETNPDE